MSLKAAFASTPGPDSLRAALVLVAKGFCMGVADIIPGVSGGTIAFITNIYDQLMAAIKSFGGEALGRLVRLDVSGFVAKVHLRFLLPLLCGILLALLSMARIMHHLLAEYPVQVWALFFGLIAASIVVVARRVGECTFMNMAFALIGAVGSYLLVGLIPVATPEALWFLFLCGSLAICAMILPGISGAFILLMLGKYEFVTGALKAPFVGDNLLVIVVFSLGALCGLMAFSRVLHYFLRTWPGVSVSLLAGVMVGAIRKVWPWKEVLETKMVRGKVLVLQEQNILPQQFDNSFWLAVGLMVVGCVTVLLMERFSER